MEVGPKIEAWPPKKHKLEGSDATALIETGSFYFRIYVIFFI